MAFKEYRSMKVYEQGGYHCKATPTIMLKGQWLKDCSFDMGTPIIVRCEDGRLTITKANEVEADYQKVMDNQPVSKAAEPRIKFG